MITRIVGSWSVYDIGNRGDCMEETVHCYFLYFCVVLSVVMGIHVEFQKPEYEVARGDQVTLTCTFQPQKPPSVAVITWSADADDPTEPQIAIGTFFYSTSASQIDISAAYKGKASMANDVAAGVSSLTFSHVSLQENRVFQCSVQIPGDNDGQLSDTTRLLVLVAPSVPVCRIQGSAEYGHNINLTCKSEEGSPQPTYKWQRFDPSNRPQPFPPRTTESNGVLSLFNVSRETSGYYVCTSTNKIRSASYNMTLSVMPPSMNIGATAGIVGGCVAGGVALLIVVYCCCCRKKKKTPQYEMEEHAAYHDKPPLETEDEDDGKIVVSVVKLREESRNQQSGYQDDPSEHYDNHSRHGDGREDRYRHDDRYEDSRRGSTDRLDRYDDGRSHSSDRPDRNDDGRSRSSDRLDRYDDSRSRSNDRLDRYDDSRSRSRDRLDRYEDSRGRSNDRLERYDDNRSRSSDRLDRYDDSRSRSSDRLDRYEGDRDRYDDRRDNYSDRNRYDDRR
ncbi:hypothetical protein ACEWY4_023368 [Coilia grayii]|uniref:Ig-like domain-containing protein n=1 Tax=Coilia grayii TaxID=363190 RepID=A0ABD1J2V2_9TELE